MPHRPSGRNSRPAKTGAPGRRRPSQIQWITPTVASPHRPPRPAASGQAAGAARADRAAESARTPPVADRALSGEGFSLCWIASPMAAASPKAMSRMAAGQAPRPSDCMKRSANKAPFRPSQLVGAAPDAAFRLGSAGFHEIRATSSRAASRAWSTPRNFTETGAPHRMRALTQARWPMARAADMRR